MELRLSNRMTGQGSGQIGWSNSLASASIEASSRLSVSLAWIGWPFRVAPSPATATKVSFMAGACTTAATGRPSSTTARATVHHGLFFMKATVPSIGSTTKVRDRDNRSGPSAVSSDSQP